MFNKKSATSLFQENDSNVPVTIFNKSAVKPDHSHLTSEYISIVRNSLGASLFEEDQLYHFQITTIKAETFTLHCKRSKFIEDFRALFSNKLPLSLRIDILEDSDSSWIFILKDDL